MDNLRLFLFAALAGVVFLLYKAWQEDYPTAAAVSSAPATAPTRTPAAPPNLDVPELGAAPAAPAQPAQSGPVPAQDTVEIVTDVLRLTVSLRGGDIIRAELLKYPLSKSDPKTPLPLLNDSLPEFFVVQSGLVSDAAAAPNHDSRFTAAQTRYTLAPDQDSLIIPLSWSDADGHRVTKTYHVTRGSYEIDLTYTAGNDTDSAWRLSPYARLWRTEVTAGEEPPFIKSFLGVANYESDNDGEYKYRKHSAKELADEPLRFEQKGGWTAMLQHYFVAAILPPSEDTNRYSARPGNSYGFLTEYVGPLRTVSAGAQAEIPLRLYIGPKLQQKLEDIAPGLQLTVDYGLLTPIAVPLFWVMNKLHGLTGNWGWSIILVTLLIKAAFYKLSEAQYRSMARMKKFAPRIQALKERYADDRERMNQAMMDLYKKEGFNPLAGCWPMLVQFPVFIALYWVLLESVELRQASFILWMNDLSSPDPYYVLPVLFGISMYLQQRLSGQSMTMDPTQQKIMNIMPIGLAIFFTFFPMGLVLYWFVSNVIGILQQWLINRRLQAEDASRH